MLRKQVCSMVAEWLTGIPRDTVSNHSWELRCHLLDIINSGREDDTFIKDDEGEEAPIVVFSRVSPNRSSNFLLHIMLVLGEFGTELELKNTRSVKESLAKAKLIPDGKTNDPEVLRKYAKKLLFRVVNEVLPLQPVTMSQMDDFIVKAEQLILSVLLHDTIPITDLPPSILTELFNQKTKELDKEWKERTELQLDSMLSNLGNIEGLPTKEAILGATKIKPVNWDLLSIPKSADQSEESHREQMMALTMGVNSINKYGKQSKTLAIRRAY